MMRLLLSVAVAVAAAAVSPARAQEDEEEAPSNPIEMSEPLPAGTPMRRQEDRPARSAGAVRAPVQSGPSYAAPATIRRDGDADDEERPAPRREAQGVGSAVRSGSFQRVPSGGAPAASGGGGGSGSGVVHVTKKLSPELSKVRWTEWDKGMWHMPEYVWGKAHPIVRISQPGVGHSVAFLTQEGFPENEGRSIICAVGNTPRAKLNSGCVMNLWISEWPSHDPIEGCGDFGAGAQPLSITGNAMYPARLAAWTKAQMPKGCFLKPGTYYYCNYAPTGWDRDDEHAPKNCDVFFNTPMSFMDERMEPPTRGARR